MTIVYSERVDSEEHVRLMQWGISLALVLMLHVVVAYFLFFREVPVEQKPVPPAAYLDLPPLSAGPLPPIPVPAPPAVTPPAPKIQSAPAPTPQPPAPPKAEAPPLPPPPKSASPAVVPPKAVPAPAPKVAPPRPQAPAPKHTQPKTAPAPAPPAQGSSTPLYVDPMREWQIAAAARLEKFKKSSQAASWQGEQGVVQLQITIDRKGHILSAAISRSSGYSTLDLQAMTMCRLARHLPPLPATFKEQTYTFGISIEFTLY